MKANIFFILAVCTSLVLAAPSNGYDPEDDFSVGNAAPAEASALETDVADDTMVAEPVEPRGLSHHHHCGKGKGCQRNVRQCGKGKEAVIPVVAAIQTKATYGTTSKKY